MDVLRGEGADASFSFFFVPSSTDSGSWVFASPAARQAFATRAAACGCTSSSVDVNESDEEELDDDDDDVAIDEFVGLVSSPAYASVAAAVQAGSIGPQLVATVRPLIAGLGVREAAATVTRAVAEVCCLLSKLRTCIRSMAPMKLHKRLHVYTQSLGPKIATPLEWAKREQYGELLASLLFDVAPPVVVAGLSEIQRAWNALPARPASLIQKIFVQLHQNDVVDTAGFFAWQNDGSVTRAIPGKAEAVQELTK